MLLIKRYLASILLQKYIDRQSQWQIFTRYFMKHMQIVHNFMFALAIDK